MAIGHKAALATSLALMSGSSAACVLGTTYNLPIPFRMYASGASAALIASFAIVGYVLKAQPAGGDSAAAPGVLRRVEDGAPSGVVPQWLVSGLGFFSVFFLLLTIAAGLLGSPNRLSNFSITFFWIIFVLGFAYVTAIIGDLYALINPWRTLCNWIDRADGGNFRGRIEYPAWLGYYPALFLYMAFIWIELFADVQPRTLSSMLMFYTGINLAAAWLVGKDAWFRYGEFFSVFFRLIGKMAPVHYVRQGETGERYAATLRKPFIGLLEEHAEHYSLLLFVLFMLSSTAFDGAHATLPWVNIFWKGFYPVLSQLVTQPYGFIVNIYYVWQWAMLLASPLFYLVAYVGLLWLAKIFARSSIPLRTLVLRFAFTLIPIAFVYNITHYYGELFIQGPQIIPMISDPFNVGWNLFGTAKWIIEPFMLDAGNVWHTQVALILFGHIVSVYLAHVEAIKIFPVRRLAVLSQLPMLALMVLLTTVGLWILSLPIDAGQVTIPALS